MNFYFKHFNFTVVITKHNLKIFMITGFSFKAVIDLITITCIQKNE